MFSLELVRALGHIHVLFVTNMFQFIIEYLAATD